MKEKDFIASQVLIMIIKGDRNLLHPPAHALGLSAKCLMQVFPGCGPRDTLFLQDALVSIFLLFSPHSIDSMATEASSLHLRKGICPPVFLHSYTPQNHSSPAFVLWPEHQEVGVGRWRPRPAGSP